MHFQPTDTPIWDEYVHAHPQATLYHLSAWKNVIEKTYGPKPIILKPEGITQATQLTQSTQQTVNYKYSSLAILYMAFISYLSSIPGGSFPGNGSLIEQTFSNLAHIPEYGLLTFLWLKAFVRRGNTDTLSVGSVLILSGVLIFAVSDEIHQSFIPGRSASLMDIGLDGLGVLLGLGALKRLGQT